MGLDLEDGVTTGMPWPGCHLVLVTSGDSEDPPLDRIPRGESAIMELRMVCKSLEVNKN